MSRQPKQRLASDGITIGNWISIGHPAIGEIAAQSGVEYVVVDTEHNPMSIGQAENLIRAVESVDENIVTIIRVPDGSSGWIKRALDTGADGVMIPMVETPEQAKTIAENAQYPPEGTRGVAPSRASDYGQTLPNYFQSANDSTITVIQIESELGVQNAKAIAETDGIDAIQIGQGDLSSSLGCFGKWEEQEFQEAVHEIMTVASSAEVPVGMLAVNHEEIEQWTEAGVDYLAVGIDTAYLSRGSAMAKERFEQVIANQTNN